MFGLFKKPAPPMDSPEVRDAKIAVANAMGPCIRLADYPVVTRNVGAMWVATLVHRDGIEGAKAYGSDEMNALHALLETLTRRSGDISPSPPPPRR